MECGGFRGYERVEDLAAVAEAQSSRRLVAGVNSCPSLFLSSFIPIRRGRPKVFAEPGDTLPFFYSDFRSESLRRPVNYLFPLVTRSRNFW